MTKVVTKEKEIVSTQILVQRAPTSGVWVMCVFKGSIIPYPSQQLPSELVCGIILLPSFKDTGHGMAMG